VNYIGPNTAQGPVTTALVCMSRNAGIQRKCRLFNYDVITYGIEILKEYGKQDFVTSFL